MTKKGLNGFFEDYLEKEALFVNKRALQDNYTPEDIPHREKEIESVAKILGPSVRLQKPSNLFIYGKTGTGKTCVVKHVTAQLDKVATKKELPIKICYINCKSQRVADTEYRVLAELIRKLGIEVPKTGLPTNVLYDQFKNILKEKKLLLIIILDEIDQLVDKIGDGILYTLTRFNSEMSDSESEISLIGISNDLNFTSRLDARVISSLKDEELMFAPYDATQLKSILEQRSQISFKEGVVNEGVLSKCAAFAAREHGDARRALELLRVAGELAERNDKEQIDYTNLDEALDKIDTDRIIEAVKINPKQFKITLYSILSLLQDPKYLKNSRISTGDVYEKYKQICGTCVITPLTQRRVSDIISELDMLGIIQSRIKSYGRGGRTRIISVNLPETTLREIDDLLKQGLNI